MGKEDKQYWDKRKKDDDNYRSVVRRTENSNKALDLKLGQEYKRVYEELVLKDLANLYSKYVVDKRGFSLTNMMKMDNIDKYTEKLKKIAQELGVKENEIVENRLLGLFSSASEDTRDKLDIDMNRDIDKSFNIVPKHIAKKVVESNWSGANYSSRIWTNKSKLVENLKGTIMRGILEGRGFSELAKDLEKVMGSTYNNTKRIVRTESMNVINQAQIDSYRAKGVEYVRVNGRDDGRACNKCIGRFEGKDIFPIDKAPYLPSHPNCRCSYIPVIDIPKEEEEEEIEGNRFEDYEKRYAKFKKEFDSSMGSFKKKFGDVNVSLIEACVENMPKREREAFLEYFNDVVFKYRSGTSHFHSEYKDGKLIKYIQFDKSYDFKNINTKELSVIFHEFGHYLHLAVGEPRNYWKNSNWGFDLYGKVADNDGKIVNDLIKRAFSGNDLEAEKEYKRVKNLLFECRGLSDNFGGLTYNKMRGYATHSDKYWKRDEQSRFEEIFANIYDIKAFYGVDSEYYKCVEKYMPESLSLYDEIMEKIAKEGRDYDLD